MSIILYRNPIYAERFDGWTTYRDTYEGNPYVMRSTRYLWPNEMETLPEGAKLRVRRECETHYTNFVEPVVSIWQSLFFRKDIDIPDSINELFGPDIDDVDGQGNSLQTFARELVSTNFFVYGAPMVKVNAPKMEFETEGEAQAQGFRPFFEVVEPFDLPDWEIEQTDPQLLGKYKFLRQEFQQQMPRQSANDR